MSLLKNNSSFLKKFSTLFIGLVLVQIINFSFSLILPKYFSPTAFAEFGIFTSIVFIFIEIANAKLDVAVMLGNTNDEAKEIVNASFTIAVLFSIILIPLGILLYYIYSKIYILIPFIVLLYGIHQPILVFLNKIEKYNAITFFRIIQVLFTSTITIYLGIQKTNHALIIGFTIGLAIATSYLFFFLIPKINIAQTKKAWKKFDQFPKYGTWSSLLNNISRNSIPILLAEFFSKQFVGFYSYSTRLLNAPTGMYTSALSQVYFKMASVQDNTTLKKSTRKIIFTTFIISIIPTLIFLFFGKEIFNFLFSGEWLEAGKVTQYLILWYFLGVIVSPITVLLDVKNKLKFEFSINFMLFTTRILAIIIGGLLHDFYLAILLFVTVGIIINAYLLYYINFVILEE